MTAILPMPTTIDAVVETDIAARTLVVKLPVHVDGYKRLLWRQAHENLVRLEQSAGRVDVPTVWASAPGREQIGFALPVAGQALQFRFLPGEPVFRELVSAPGLVASVEADVSARHFLSVRFFHRRR